MQKPTPKEKDPINACSIMITCGAPDSTGNMQVEMTYEGDSVLAAYLLENAQSFVFQEKLPSPTITLMDSQ